MGIYVNPVNRAFIMSRFSEIYIDKSMLIERINKLYNTEKRFICVSRPRRFGKSMAANMLAAYYSRGCDSAKLFAGLKIETAASFPHHLNRHNVIRLDIQQFLESRRDLPTFIAEIERAVREELAEVFPECGEFPADSRLKTVLNKIFSRTGQSFIFIIDEWDCVFRVAKEQQESWELLPLEEHMAHYEQQGMGRKEAMKLVAKDRGISKREVYGQLLEHTDKASGEPDSVSVRPEQA